MSMPSVIPPSLSAPNSTTVIQGAEFPGGGQFCVACERRLATQSNHWMVLERSPTMTLEEKPQSGENVFTLHGDWMRVAQNFDSREDALAFVSARKAPAAT